MKQLQFFGASGEVTGSSYLLTLSDDTQILVDLGMFQGSDELEALNYAPLQFSPSKLSAVFLTHAHLDHCGRLPLLIFGGYFKKIYMTAPTRALVEVVLTDSAHIAEKDFTRKPLYTMDEVEKVMKLIEVVEYDTPIFVDRVQATFRDAGHILGSSSIELRDTSSSEQETLVFSGDLGNFPEDIVRPTRLIAAADYVVMETTYGDKQHPKENKREIIQEEINEVEKNGGVLLVPAFSLERTQEVLHNINHLKKDGLVRADTPIFLDSPMGIHATLIFKDFRSFYNKELQAHADDPFSFPGLVVTEEARDSKEIIRAMNPKVIIAGSGMMSGGRILHHAVNYLDRPHTRILFVGYQAEETLGRKILEGARHVQIDRQSIRVKAHVREIASMSSHADQPKLLEWLRHINGVKKVFLTHGDPLQRRAFAEKVKELGMREVFLPKIGDKQSL